MRDSEYRFKHSKKSLEKQTKCGINVWDRQRRPENLFSEESSLHFGNTAVSLLFMISVSADLFSCGQSVLSASPPQRSLHVYEFVLPTVVHVYSPSIEAIVLKLFGQAVSAEIKDQLQLFSRVCGLRRDFKTKSSQWRQL